MQSNTIKQQSWERLVLCQKAYFSPKMEKALQNIESSLLTPIKVFKQDKTSMVALIEIEGARFVVKKAKTKNVLHFFRRAFQCSRAKRNWRNAKMLAQAEISTFEPIAIVENRWGPFKGCNYLLMSYLEGQDALTYYQAASQSQWQDISKEIVALIEKLHLANIRHCDLNLSNFLFVKDKLYLLDLDGMRQKQFGWPTKLFFEREKTRFLKNCSDVGLHREAQNILKRMLFR